MPGNSTALRGTWFLIWAYAGNPFGEQQPTSSSGYVLNLRYPGQYFDAESGTNYNVNRTYEPATGRYLSARCAPAKRRAMVRRWLTSRWRAIRRIKFAVSCRHCQVRRENEPNRCAGW